MASLRGEWESNVLKIIGTVVVAMLFINWAIPQFGLDGINFELSIRNFASLFLVFFAVIAALFIVRIIIGTFLATGTTGLFRLSYFRTEILTIIVSILLLAIIHAGYLEFMGLAITGS